MADSIQICVVTGSRADYERLHPVLVAFRAEPRLTPFVVATHMHLSPEYGVTVRDIEADGFEVEETVESLLSTTTDAGLTKSVGLGMIGLADVLARRRPDVVAVLGDRVELLAVAGACVSQRTPLLHLCGGEITEGAVDDQVRHMVTKAAHLHCVANDVFRDRVLQMGEESWRVSVSGSPALDVLREFPYLEKAELTLDLGLDLDRDTALVTYHPVTLGGGDTQEQIDHVLEALGRHDLQYVITYPNADVGSDVIVRAIEAFGRRAPARVRVVPNLGRRRYFSLLRHVVLMVGNSSSGIVEAPSFGVPVVNIGDRQKGRVFGENVVHVPCHADAIADGMDAARAMDRATFDNPYGDMHAAPRIAAFLADTYEARGRDGLLLKRFVEPAPVTPVPSET